MTESGEPQPELPPKIDLYRIAVDEYRFQVKLNWERTQHWFALNTALTAAAIALLKLADHPATYLLVSGVFICGVATCAAAWVGATTQHNYYREIRDQKRAMEERMGLGVWAIAQTPGMGSERKRRASVTTLHKTVVFLFAVVNLAGAGYGIYEAATTNQPQTGQREKHAHHGHHSN